MQPGTLTKKETMLDHMLYLMLANNASNVTESTMPTCIYEDASEFVNKPNHACKSDNGDGYVIYQLTNHDQVQINSNGTIEFYQV